MDFVSFVLVFCFIFIFISLLSTSRNRKLPPGPWGLPLIGHLHLFRGRLPHEALHSVSQKFGPIVRIRLGLIPTVLVSSPDLAKEILTTQDANFASRPYIVAGEYLEYGCVGLSTSPYGEHYRSLRKLCSTELFTSRCINSFSWARQDVLSDVLREVLRCHSRNEAVEIRSCISVCIFNAITQIACSKKYFTYQSDLPSGLDADAAEFKSLIKQMVELVLKPCLSNFVPWYLRWLDWQIPYYKELQRNMNKLLQKIVDEHKNTNRECKDIVDMLLDHFGQGTQAETYTKAALVSIIAAGTDTSVVTSEWLLAAMMQHPRVMKKVQEELDNVVGPSRMVKESDLPKLDYFQMVIKETMRRYPTAPMVMPRIAASDTVVGGYNVPKGMTLMINTWALANDAAVWKNPSEFIPERFMETSIDYKGQDFELLPFGAGRRKCPGMALAMRIVELFVANFVHGFDWKFETATPPSMEAVYGGVCMPKTPLRVIPTPRLPKDAYTKI